MLSYLFTFVSLVDLHRTEKVDNALCSGPLKHDLPVRYLHIQLRHGEINITHSIGALKVSTSGSCRFRSHLIDNHDGSYILRIRLWSSCSRMVVDIRTPDTVPLCGSPIVLEKGDGNLLHSEYCDCPSKSISEWIREVECTTEHTQLKKDLSQWSEIDFKKVLQTVRNKWAGPSHRYSIAFCHYQVIDNNLYRQCYGEYTGFRIFVDAMLTSMMRKMYLPNSEFIFNLGDWPLVKIGSDPIPMISWCGSGDTMDVVMPSYELMKSVIDSLESTTLDIHSVRGEKYYRWNEKKDTAIFRGRDSCELRLRISKLSKSYPELLDAGITQYFFFNQSEQTPPVKKIPFPDFFQHKFILSIDGTVAAYRFPFLLAGDSVIFKSFSDYYEYFYADLKERVHFFHFNDSNLIEQIKWARTRDYNETLKAMRQFVLDHLQPLNIYCYYANFLQKYTSKLKQIPIKPADGMEVVLKVPPEKQFSDRSCECSKLVNHGRKKNRKQEF